MSIIYKGNVIADVGGGVSMEQVNAAIQDAVADIRPLEVYSTEETRIGTWIDGKPLYRRVFSFETSVVGSWSLVHDPIPLATVQIVDACIHRTTGEIMAIGQLGNTLSSVMYDSQGLKYWTNHASMFGTWYAFVSYTKTTDEATS